MRKARGFDRHRPESFIGIEKTDIFDCYNFDPDYV